MKNADNKKKLRMYICQDLTTPTLDGIRSWAMTILVVETGLFYEGLISGTRLGSRKARYLVDTAARIQPSDSATDACPFEQSLNSKCDSNYAMQKIKSNSPRA